MTDDEEEDNEKTESEITDGEYTTEDEPEKTIQAAPATSTRGGFGLFGKKEEIEKEPTQPKAPELPKPSLFGTATTTPGLLKMSKYTFCFKQGTFGVFDDT